MDIGELASITAKSAKERSIGVYLSSPLFFYPALASASPAYKEPEQVMGTVYFGLVALLCLANAHMNEQDKNVAGAIGSSIGALFMGTAATLTYLN